MTVAIVVVSVVLLGMLVAHVARLIARDGYGTVAPPRSHIEEIGTWVDQQFSR